MKWPMYPFSEVAEIVTGNTPPKRDPDNYGPGVPWVKPPDLDSWEPITNTVETLSSKGQKIARLLPEGTVMVCCIGSIGRVGIAGTTLATNQQINSLVFHPQIIPKFGFYYCRSIGQVFEAAARKAVVPILNKSNFAKIKMPIPPLSEQLRIVEILDQADKLGKKRAEADAKAARILPALFYKMFGDPATNPKGWPIISFGEVVAGTRNGLYKPMSYYGRGTPILKMFNIQNGELDLTRIDSIDVEESEYEAYALLPGDILLNRVNTPELVGKCAVITEAVGKAVFESKNIRIRLSPEKAHCEYVAAYLNSSFGHSSLRSGVKHAIGMATINNSDLRGVNIPLPLMPLQKTWASIVQSHRALQDKRVKARDSIAILSSVLLHRAFTGDLTAKWREAHMKELLAEMES
jgi:type I restriction enzyme S subunit